MTNFEPTHRNQRRPRPANTKLLGGREKQRECVRVDMKFTNQKQGLQFNVKEVALVASGKENPDLERDYLLIRIGIHFQSGQNKADAMVSLPIQKWLHPQDGTSIIDILSDEAADADSIQGGRTLKQYTDWIQKGIGKGYDAGAQ